MQNSERQQFERNWKSAFDGAEMSPSDSVWSSIEADLAGSETAVMKRRVVFYQRLAAATIIFAIASAAIAVYNYQSSDELAVTTSASETSAPAATPDKPAVAPEAKAEVPSSIPSANAVVADNNIKSGAVDNVQRSVRDDGSGTTKLGGTDNTVSPALAVVPKDDDTNVRPHNDRNEAAADGIPTVPVIEQTFAQVIPETEVVAPDKESVENIEVAELLSADQINALAEAKEEAAERDDHRSLWLGVGGAAGSYAPQSGLRADASPSNFYSSTADAQGVPQSVRHDLGSAYSAGVSGGMKLSRRWILQSGISYLNQKVDHTTNFVGITHENKAMALTSEYTNANSLAAVTVTNPYEVSNITEILSVPVQTGFLVVDRKFGWQLNTGLSTDFFLKNTIADKSGSRQKISEGAGQDSPYRQVNFSGLLNTEFSYRLGDHYRVAVVPGMRYSLNPMLKGQTNGTAMILDVGFRFNYLFR